MKIAIPYESGMVFQHFNLFNNMNVLDNLMLAPLELKKADKKEARARAEEMLKRVDLLEKADSYPSQLSGGQQQRTAIGRAIVKNPDILLCDEPTGALDSKTGHMVMDLFHKLHEEQGKTIVLITHSQELAAETKRIVTILDGNIVSDNGGEG